MGTGLQTSVNSTIAGVMVLIFDKVGFSLQKALNELDGCLVIKNRLHSEDLTINLLVSLL